MTTITESRAPTPQAGDTSYRQRLLPQLAAIYLLLSGIASLTYQVTWVRLLGLSIGATAAAIGTVLAAFFFGMAAGSYLAERITRNRIHDLRAYVVLEALIGLSGLLLLPALLHLDLIMAWLPAGGGSLGVKFMLAMILLCIPTACMGATFPVMASILIRREGDMGRRLSRLYSLNTAGAVLGAGLSGFVFIPLWGLDGAIFIAVALNLAIALSAVYFNRRLHLPPLETSPATARAGDKPAFAPLRIPAAIVLFATGFVAIATEVGWTKYLIIFAGSTIYGFAAILTIFLLGIAAGAWAMQSRLSRLRNPPLALAGGLIALAGALLLTRAGLSLVPTIYEAINHLAVPGAVMRAVKYAVIFALLFPPTFLFGALFPLNLQLYCGDLAGVRTRIGRAYAINTVASVTGSILAGFYIIPRFGTDTLLTSMAAVILVLPLLFLTSLPQWQPRAAIAALAAGALIAAWTLPHLDYRALIASVDYRYDMDVEPEKNPEFLFLREGKAGVVSVVTHDGVIAKVQNNGLKESIIDLHDPYRTLLMESLLGLLPYFLHDNPKSAFVLGYGGGVTTRALAFTDVGAVRVVELEPAMIEAARLLYPRGPAWLDDARVRVDINDARNTLLVEKNQRYDIVAAQPSHPWRAGAANVFTQEFFSIVRSRMNPGGIYAQWVNLFNMDATTLRAIFKAFYTVFPHGMSFAHFGTGDYVLIGSMHPLQFDYARMATRMARPGIKELLRRHAIHEPKALLTYFGLSRAEMVRAAGAATPNNDTNILSEVRLSALERDAPSGAEEPYGFLLAQFNADLAPYFPPASAGLRLYDLGTHVLANGYWEMAQKIGQSLRGIDSVRAQWLDYELLWSAYDFDAAFALYAQRADWPDRIRRQQVQALADTHRFAAAARVLRSINNRHERAYAKAALFYARQQWARLAQLEPVDATARAWRALGNLKLHRNDGASLVSLVSEGVDDLALLAASRRILATHTGTTPERAQRVTDAVAFRSRNLVRWAQKALADKRPEYAAVLLGKLADLNPDAQELSPLRAQLARLSR